MLGQTKSDAMRHSGHPLQKNINKFPDKTFKLSKIIPSDIVLKLLCLSPGTNAVKAEAVVAVGQDAKALLPWVLFDDGFETDSTHFVLGARHCK